MSFGRFWPKREVVMRLGWPELVFVFILLVVALLFLFRWIGNRNKNVNKNVVNVSNVITTSSSANFCSNCGEKLGTDMRFCPKCGTKLEATTQTSQR
jgi:hypothetical protein